jgi:hypothetical protein
MFKEVNNNNGWTINWWFYPRLNPDCPKIKNVIVSPSAGGRDDPSGSMGTREFITIVIFGQPQLE